MLLASIDQELCGLFSQIKRQLSIKELVYEQRTNKPVESQIDPALNYFSPVTKLLKSGEDIMFVIQSGGDSRVRSITMWLDSN